MALGVRSAALLLYSISTAFLYAQPPSTVLEPNAPVPDKLAGGQTHSYQIAADAGQYLELEVLQESIDVTVTLFGPDGKKLLVWRGHSESDVVLLRDTSK